MKKNILLAIFFISIISFFFIYNSNSSENQNKLTLTDKGILKISSNHEKINVNVHDIKTYQNYTKENISFQSNGFIVNAILRVPKSEKKLPGVVLLPGATVTKEGNKHLAETILEMGYASISIDQRNLGIINFKYDFQLFLEGKQPLEYGMIYDALRSADVLRQDKRIDKDKVVIIGESNGGRIGIIATAIDKNIAGVIGISTSGYDMDNQLSNIKDEKVIKFYRSIDPDTYLDMIPPRKIVLMHGKNDTIIPIKLSKRTFNKAKQPKSFYEVNSSRHGYSDKMKQPLENELKSIFSK